MIWLRRTLYYSALSILSIEHIIIEEKDHVVFIYNIEGCLNVIQ